MQMGLGWGVFINVNVKFVKEIIAVPRARIKLGHCELDRSSSQAPSNLKARSSPLQLQAKIGPYNMEPNIISLFILLPIFLL